MHVKSEPAKRIACLRVKKKFKKVQFAPLNILLKEKLFPQITILKHYGTEEKGTIGISLDYQKVLLM